MSPDGTGEVLCGCTGLMLASFVDFVAANPHKGFEAVLTETGAGQTCTACLLDLEHHYVRAVQSAARVASPPGAVRTVKPPQRSLKRRLYALVDGLAPLVPYRFRDVAPVLYGGGIGEWLWVSNHSMMFEDKVAAPAFRLDLVLRNRRGQVVAHMRERVAQGETLRRDLSAPLAVADPDAAGALRIGWLELIRRSEGPGVRGTTRPQFEIEAPAGTCAVHTQAATPPTASGLTLRLRPGEDRAFLSVLNIEGRPLRFRLSLSAPELPPQEERVVTVAPKGIELIELTVPERTPAGPSGILADVSWSADRTHKVHVLFASPGLDQFSVDHA